MPTNKLQEFLDVLNGPVPDNEFLDAIAGPIERAIRADALEKARLRQRFDGAIEVIPTMTAEEQNSRFVPAKVVKEGQVVHNWLDEIRVVFTIGIDEAEALRQERERVKEQRRTNPIVGPMMPWEKREADIEIEANHEPSNP